MHHELSLLVFHGHDVQIRIQNLQCLFLIEITMKGHKLLTKLLQYNVKLLLRLLEFHRAHGVPRLE